MDLSVSLNLVQDVRKLLFGISYEEKYNETYNETTVTIGFIILELKIIINKKQYN